MKVQEFIDAVNNCEEKLYSLWDIEDNVAPDVHFSQMPELVEEGIEVDEHRWYFVATNVYKCDDGYVGVRGVWKLLSEQMDYSDCNIICHADEYEQVQTVTYKQKK